MVDNKSNTGECVRGADSRCKTCRTAGAVGGNAIVPRIVSRMAHDGRTFDCLARILDFGCGAHQQHVRALKTAGYNVTGTDLSIEEKPDPQDFDVVYASNVLNVQETDAQLNEMLNSVINYLDPRAKWGGIFIVNYPSSPRKLPYDVKGMERVLKSKFADVVRVPKDMAGANIVWCCSSPWERMSRYSSLLREIRKVVL